MPAVSVQRMPSPPNLRNGGSSSSALPITPRAQDEMSVAEIREKAKSNAQKARGGSATTLIKLTRDHAILGSQREKEGDLRGALSAYFTAANLCQLVYETAEFKQGQQGRKSLNKEFIDFQQQYGNDLIPRTLKLEAKLSELERTRPSTNGVSANEEVNKPPASIADRLRSLQDAGMSVKTTKRVSRDLSLSQNTTSIEPSRTLASSRISSSQRPLSLPPLSPTSSRSQNGSIDASVHSIVTPTSLGPPSSASLSSPRTSHFSSISEFSHAFPSIDELDEARGEPSSSSYTFPTFPSVPSNKPGVSLNISLASPITPSTMSRFPSLPLDRDPGPRPASTPIPPSLDTLLSRPGSPSRRRSPNSPSLPPKPINLSSPRVSPSMITPTASGERPDLPATSSLAPNILHEYIRNKHIRVLLLDVRNRDDFEREHISADAVVCLEPHVLARDGLSAEMLEDSLSVAPRHESAVFCNRGTFDLVVMYDENSTSLGSADSALPTVMRVIYDNAFRQMLKRPPVILVGGLKAWKVEFPNELATGGKKDLMMNEADVREALDTISPLDRISALADRPRFPEPSTSSVSILEGTNGLGITSEHQHEIWTPRRPRSGTDSSSASSPVMNGVEHAFTGESDSKSRYSVEPTSEDMHSNSDQDYPVVSADSHRRLHRKTAITRRPSGSSLSSSGVRTLYDTMNGSHISTNFTGQNVYYNGNAPSIQYPSFPLSSPSNFASGIVSPPPQASINPSPLSRRRSDFIDQSEQAVSSFSSRPSIDYPDLSTQHILRPPPAVATPPSERQDNRPRIATHTASFPSSSSGPKPPKIQSDYPISYFMETQIATSGLKNLGNTCYMNSTIQCLSATVPFTRFFTDGRWKSAVNMVNTLGTKGHVTQAFASILHEMWHEGQTSLSPYSFRRSICVYGKQFAGSEQHDSQEFLNFLLDGLHEDLNRILQKPINEVSPDREAELEVLPQQIASEQEWTIYRMRNDSIIVDFFQGQFRNRLECLTCHKTSTTYNAFMYLTLPIPAGRGVNRVNLQQCLDTLVNEEIMEKSDAWNCPRCKALRRATKRLSLSRLPPILLIHLKRFSFKGPFTDKLETFVDFPLTGLDLTNYMPPPLPPGLMQTQKPTMSSEDPRSQLPPYRYDLYAVTNHFGTLSSGHYTAFVKSRGNWMYCDDSRVTQADAKEVVGRPAYVLFYKRTKS